MAGVTTYYHLEIKPVADSIKVDDKAIELLNTVEWEYVNRGLVPEDFDPDLTRCSPFTPATYKMLRVGFSETSAGFAELRDCHSTTIRWLAEHIPDVDFIYTESDFGKDVTVTTFSGEGWHRRNDDARFYEFLIGKLGGDHKSLYQEFIDSKNV